jgi:TRAP-type C4-dicarboxylate transport system substrate-binding protein
MKRRNLFVLSVMVVLVLALTMLYSPAPSLGAAHKVIRWKGQTAYTYPTDAAGIAFGKWIEKRSGGRLVMDVEPPGTIVPVGQMFSAVSKGLLDFAGTYNGVYHAGMMPETDIETGLPLAWEFNEEVWDAYYRRGLLDKIRKVYAEKNVFFLAPCSAGQISQIMATFPIKSLKDLKGKKIGGVGIYGEFIKLLGATPVSVPYPERYMALKLGTIDGVYTGGDMLETLKLKELVTHFIISPSVGCYANSLIVNMASWNALPDDIKKFLDEETRFVVMEGGAMLGAIECRLAIAKAAKEYKVKLVHLPDEEVEWLRNETMTKLWGKVASKSPRCAELVELVKQQMRDLGKLK